LLRYKEIFIGNQCNNRCLYCSYRQKDLLQPDYETIIASINKPFMPVQISESPLRPPLKRGDEREFEKKGLSPEKEDGIVFYGGEPTLRSDLLEIINSAKRKGYRRIKLITNGRAFSDIQILYRIIQAGCSLFEIKLWGSNPSIHDHITQSAGSFWETLRGFENMFQIPGERFVCVRIPICRENYTDIENTVATVLSLGIHRIILSYQDVNLELADALPHIKNAINISIFNRIWILTEGLPFCVMCGLEPHIGEIYTGWDTVYGRLFQQHEYCIDCIFRELCPGVEKEYLRKFGEKGFLPVKESRNIKDIKAFYE